MGGVTVRSATNSSFVNDINYAMKPPFANDMILRRRCENIQIHFHDPISR